MSASWGKLFMYNRHKIPKVGMNAVASELSLVIKAVVKKNFL